MRHPRAHYRPSRQQRCSLVWPTNPSTSCTDQPAWAEPVAHLLLPGEVAKTQADAYGWRWEPTEVNYDGRLLLLGGPIGMAITGFASVMANRGARRRAEREAAHAWRPLGPLTVVATDLRLLVWHQGVWDSVWYSAVADLSIQSESRAVELYFAADAPFLLHSQDVLQLVQHIGREH